MNKIRKLSRKSKIAVAGFCLIIIVMAVGIYGITNNNPSTTQSVAPDTLPHTTSPSNATSDYTTKVSSITKESNAILNDSYTVLDKLTTGEMDENTAISRLQNDKERMSGSLSEIQSLTPPQNLQHFHSLLVSAFQDLNQALSLEISGLKNSNANDIQSAADLTNSAVSKLNEAKKETNQTN